MSFAMFVSLGVAIEGIRQSASDNEASQALV